MATNMECVGLPIASFDDLRAFTERIIDDAVVYLSRHDLQVARWQDPSGVRLTYLLEGGQIADHLPSYAAPRLTRLSQLTRVSKDVAFAEVLDDGGDQIGAVAITPEQVGVLPMNDPLPTLDARVVFLGNDVTVHADGEAFSASPASLLDPNGDPNEPQPESERARGLKWPPRIGPESFFSYGTFAHPSVARPNARFAGTVITAQRLTVAATGTTFIAAEVDTIGIQACVCLPGDQLDTIPTPGQVLTGYVYVVGSLDAMEPRSADRPADGVRSPAEQAATRTVRKPRRFWQRK